MLRLAYQLQLTRLPDITDVKIEIEESAETECEPWDCVISQIHSLAEEAESLQQEATKKRDVVDANLRKSIERKKYTPSIARRSSKENIQVKVEPALVKQEPIESVISDVTGTYLKESISNGELTIGNKSNKRKQKEMFNTRLVLKETKQSRVKKLVLKKEPDIETLYPPSMLIKPYGKPIRNSTLNRSKDTMIKLDNNLGGRNEKCHLKTVNSSKIKDNDSLIRSSSLQKMIKEEVLDIYDEKTMDLAFFSEGNLMEQSQEKLVKQLEREVMTSVQPYTGPCLTDLLKVSPSKLLHKNSKEKKRKGMDVTSIEPKQKQLKLTIKLEPGSLTHTPRGKIRNKNYCGKCKGCKILEDCGKCINCLDKPKFGGNSIRKQRCIMRSCRFKASLLDRFDTAEGNRKSGLCANMSQKSKSNKLITKAPTGSSNQQRNLPQNRHVLMSYENNKVKVKPVKLQKNENNISTKFKESRKQIKTFHRRQSSIALSP